MLLEFDVERMSSQSQVSLIGGTKSTFIIIGH